jgi:hypothetical protein
MVHSQNGIMKYCRRVSCRHVAKSEWCHAVMVHSQNGIMQYCRMVACTHVVKSEWCHAVIVHSQNGIIQYCIKVSLLTFMGHSHNGVILQSWRIVRMVPYNHGAQSEWCGVMQLLRILKMASCING